VPYAVGAGVGASRRPAYSSLLSHVIDEVTGTATSDVVNWSLVGSNLALTLEFLVEAEHGSLLLAVEVSCAATACGEVGIWCCWADGSLRCWASGIRTGADTLWVDLSSIAGAAASRVEVVGRWDRWVWLGDSVGHFDRGVVDLLCSLGGEDV